MKEIVVSTKEELEEAVKNKVDTIVVKGELAKKVKATKELQKKGKIAMGITITILTAAFALAPATGGLSRALAAPIAATTGLSIVAIMSVFFLGITLVMLVTNGYDIKIGANGKIDNVEGEITLEKKRSE